MGSILDLMGDCFSGEKKDGKPKPAAPGKNEVAGPGKESSETDTVQTIGKPEEVSSKDGAPGEEKIAPAAPEASTPPKPMSAFTEEKKETKEKDPTAAFEKSPATRHETPVEKDAAAPLPGTNAFT